MTNKKKKPKTKIFLKKLKREIEYQKTAIFILIIFLLFPIIIGLIYKIPVTFVDIEIGDLLSFYAVTLGLFSTYLIHRKSEEKEALIKQEYLRPRLELTIELDNNTFQLKFYIFNTTENDYVINYIECDNGEYENEKRYYLNAKTQKQLTINTKDKNYPESVVIGIKDENRHEWLIGFEHQNGITKYCRTFIDPTV